MAIVKNLDFADLREDFKNFLSSQDEFTDYDFTQSGLDQMINLMAYGIHYDAIQANFSNAEMFLESAQLRKNVTGRAKHLMYTPKSRVAPTAMINLTVEEGDAATLPNTLFLPKGTKFATVNSLTETLGFVTTKAYVTNRQGGGIYNFTHIPIIQGAYTNTYEKYDGTGIEIPNTNVDISTVEVYVQENPNSTDFTKYERMTDLFDAKSDSAVFYIEENFNERYEVYFGDGILGKSVATGLNILITYVITDGANANGYAAFSYAKTPNTTDAINDARFKVTTVDKASGGAERESIDSIKFNAPKFFSSQKIILNDTDATNVIPYMFPDIRSVNVWSGKGTGVFGKTYISLNPYVDNLPDWRIAEIIAAVEKSRFVILTDLVHVPPTYIDLGINLNVYFDGVTNIQQLEADLYTKILDYSKNNIEDFKKKFISSKFIKAITSDVAQYDFSIYVLTRIPIFVNTLQGYDFSFKNEVISVSTNTFTYQEASHYIKNVGGVLNLYNADSNNLVKAIGTIDLLTGSGIITDINIQSITDNTMTITAIPKRESIFSSDNNILRIQEQDIKITYEVVA
jgi:hypothetical protein